MQLGQRMKDLEQDWRIPRNSFYMVRVDGKAFHTWTRGFKKPYDQPLRQTFISSIHELVHLQGLQLVYHQSDEVSFLFCDLDSYETEHMFSGRVQKIASVMASNFTSVFNRIARHSMNKDDATFDCRVFPISQLEIVNYFLWRVQDAQRNSIASLAQSYFSAKHLYKKNSAEMLEMLRGNKVEWEDQLAWDKWGYFVTSGRLVAILTPVYKEIEDFIIENVKSYSEPFWRNHEERL